MKNKLTRIVKSIRKNGFLHFFKLLKFHFITIIYFKTEYLKTLLKNNFTSEKIVLFYPDKPSHRHVIWKLCNMIGYKIINNLSKKFSFAINWQDKTFKTPDEKIKEVNKKIPVLNINCNDISKQNIGVVFKKIFGYSLDINPKKYGGKCVRKPNLNASGIGHVINCPSKKEKGFAYEKLINTKNNEGLLVDFRVPIFKDIIPCVQLRYKSPNPIFIDSLKKIEIKESKEIFSKSELKKIFLFCKRLGMDYGELDILRDKDNNKIYIVDANTTPFGPHGLPRKITKEILKKSSIAFAEMIKNN